MIWNISGKDLPKVTVEADSFDEAIHKAREISPEYCTGQRQRDCDNCYLFAMCDFDKKASYGFGKGCGDYIYSNPKLF